MHTVADALAAVLAHVAPRPAEPTPLSPAALGRVLAEAVHTDADSPPFDKALMDGFAVRAADLPGGAGELAVRGATAAGDDAAAELAPGHAVAISTGAPLPAGADAVVKVELTERLAGGRVRVADPSLVPGRNVMPRGTELRAGAVALPAGTVLTPVALGVAAAAGRVSVLAVPPPRVAVLVTGSELVEAAVAPAGGQIRNTNGPVLVALAARAGAVARYLGVGRDDPAQLAALVAEALATADVLVMSGGVSVGAHDHTPGVLAALGVTVHVHKVRMKPGKPLLFGTLAGAAGGPPRLVFGLPGNPVSALVGFELFVRPALKVLAGHPPAGPPRRRLPLAQALAANHDRPTYHPATVSPDGSAVDPLRWAGSADLRAVLGADALIELPAGPVDLAAGALVDVVLM